MQALNCRRWGGRPTLPPNFALSCRRSDGRPRLPPYASAGAGFTRPPPVRSGSVVVGRCFADVIAHGMLANVPSRRKRRFLEYSSVLEVTLFLPKCNFQELENFKFQNHGLLEIICFAKRGGWFEKYAPGSPPRHDAQFRLINAQKEQLRGVVGLALCTCHTFCSPIFGSHLHNS